MSDSLILFSKSVLEILEAEVSASNVHQWSGEKKPSNLKSQDMCYFFLFLQLKSLREMYIHPGEVQVTVDCPLCLLVLAVCCQYVLVHAPAVRMFCTCSSSR